MKATIEEKKLAKRAELYTTISMRRLAMLFKVDRSDAQRILDRAVKKGFLKYKPVRGRIQLQPTRVTAQIL